MLDPGQKKGSYYRGGSKKGTNPRGDALEHAYMLKQFKKKVEKYRPFKPSMPKVPWGPKRPAPKNRKPFI